MHLLIYNILRRWHIIFSIITSSVILTGCKEKQENDLQMNLIGIEEGASIAIGDLIDVQVEFSNNPSGIDKVEFFLNNNSIGEDTSSPFVIQYDTKDHEPGSYKLKVVAYETTAIKLSEELDITLFYDFDVNLPIDGTYSGDADNAGYISFTVEGDKIKNFRRYYFVSDVLLQELRIDFATMIPTKDGFKAENSRDLSLTGSYDGKNEINGSLIMNNSSYSYIVSILNPTKPPLPPQPPIAEFTVEPEEGNFLTTFQFDASGCSDYEDELEELKVRWDFDGDYDWDTEWLDSKQIEYKYEIADWYYVKMEVIDSDSIITSVRNPLNVNRFLAEKSFNKEVIRDEMVQIPGEGYVSYIDYGDNQKSLIKYDQEWNPVYEKEIETEATWDKLRIEHIIPSSGGGVIIYALAGYNKDELGIIHNWDLLFLKVDNNGTETFRAQHTDTVHTFIGKRFVETPDGGFIVLGGRWDPSDIFIAEFDHEGNYLWGKTILAEKDKRSFDLVDVTLSDNNEIVALYNRRDDVHNDGVLLVIMDMKGNVISEVSLFGESDNTGLYEYDNVYANFFRKSDDGGYLFGGYEFGGGTLICKIDQSGTLLWNHNPTVSGEFVDVIMLPDNELVWLRTRIHGNWSNCNLSLYKTNQTGEISDEYWYSYNMAWRLFLNDDGTYSLICSDDTKGRIVRTVIPF